MFSKHQWVLFFLHGGIQFHTFASYALPCQMPFCHTTPLLPSVTHWQNVMECWWEGSAPTAIPPTSASHTVGQHNKVGGITFGTSLTHYTTPTAPEYHCSLNIEIRRAIVQEQNSTFLIHEPHLRHAERWVTWDVQTRTPSTKQDMCMKLAFHGHSLISKFCMNAGKPQLFQCLC